MSHRISALARFALSAFALLFCLAATPAQAQVDLQFKYLRDLRDPVPAGGVLTYEIEVESNNVGTANASTLSLPLPPSFTFLSATTGTGTCTYASGPHRLDCAFGNLVGTLSGGAPVPIVVRVRPTVPGVYIVRGDVATTSTEVNTANNEQTQNTTVIDGADLRFQTFAGPVTNVVAGSTFTYTTVVQNLGPSAAANASIHFTLAVGVEFQGGTSGANWSCSVTGGNITVGQLVTCNYSTSIANAANAATLTWNARVAGNQVGTLTSTGDITSTTADGDPDNNKGSASITVVAGTDLQTVKTISANPVIGEQPVTFTLQINNLGPHPASGLTVTDTIPAGFTGITTTGTDPSWACTVTGQLVECTRPALAVGSAPAILITATAPLNTSITPPSGVAMSNTATVTQTSQEAVPSNNSGTVNFTLKRDGVDMTPVNVNRGPGPVAQGSSITTTFQVRNDGPRVATGVIRATYTLDPGEDFVSASGGGWSCSFDAPTRLVTCTRNGPINVGATTPQITVVTTATGTGTVNGTMCVSQGAGLQPIEGEVDPTNDCITRGVSSTAAIADLQLTKAVTPSSLPASANTLTYSLTITNNGPSDAGNVRLTDPIPMYASAYTAGSASRPATTVAVTDAAGGTCSVGATVTCDWTSFPNGTSRTVTISVQRLMLAGSFTNTASVFSSTVGDPNRANNTSSASTTVDAMIDVALTQKSASPPTGALAGVHLVYTIQARNLGPAPADTFRITDTFTSIPGGLTFISATASDGGTCSSYNTTTNTVSCDYGTVPSTGVRTMTVTVRPDYQASPPSPRTFENEAVVSTTTPESDATNNRRTRSVDISPAEIDVLIEETDLRDPVGFDTTAPGSNLIVYQVKVRNNGPSYATGVTFTDQWSPPPAAPGKTLTYLCDLPSATATSTCPAVPTNLCTIAATPRTVRCDVQGTTGLGNLNVNEESFRYIIYRVDNAPATTGDTFRKDAAVTANEPETLSLNNAVVESTTVRMLADMHAVSKTASSATVSLNEPFNFTITVRNNGPSTAVAARLTDNLPSGMVLTGAPITTSLGTCTPYGSGLGLTCAFGDMATNATATVTVPVRVTTFPSGGTITNRATVATDSIDTTSTNNEVDGTVTVIVGSIAGSVFIDNDDTGIRGAKPGISGVRVTLTGKDLWNNDVSQTRTTDGSGNFLFSNLPPSDAAGYQIVEAQPAGYFDGRENKAGTVVSASKGIATTTGVNDPATDVITAITLTAGQNLTGYTFGELAPASIAGIVWHDRNMDGVVNGGEVLLSGVRVELTGTDDLGNVISTPLVSTTNSSGAYSFANLRPGTYRLTEIQPATHLPGIAVVGTGANGGAAGTADNATGSSTYGNVIDGVRLRAGDAAVAYNFAEYLPGSLAGIVYYDIDNSNTREANEPFIANVTVTLTGTDYLGRTVTAATATTDVNGAYSFTNLQPGTYRIAETQPSDYIDGRRAVGSLGGAAGTSTDDFTAIPLRSADAGTGYNFGERSAGVSGFVYDDLNDDGIKQAGEAGIPNVTIRLQGCGVDRTTTTDSLGFYQFVGLPACANFTLTETQPPGFSDGRDTAGSAGGSTAVNDIISGINVGATTFATNNNFGEHNRGVTNLTCTSVAAATSAPTPGLVNVRQPFNWVFTVRNTTSVGAPAATLASTLPAGLELTGTPTASAGTCTGTTGTTGVSCALGYINGLTNVTVTAPVRVTTFPSSGTSYTAGATVGTEGSDNNASDNVCSSNVTVRQSTLAGTVFEDPNDDGVKQPTEAGIGNVTLRLTGRDIYGNDVEVTTTTNPSDGTYRFTGLAPADPAGYTLTETQPALYADGRDTVGSAGGTQSTNDVITSIVLGEGVGATGYNFAEISQGIAGTVYVDTNNDGIPDPAERRLSGVTVRVTGVSSTGSTVDVTTTTDVDGNYLFGGIPPSNAAGYTIIETQPPQFADGRDTAGVLGGNTTINDRISNIVLPAGRVATGYNFGERGGRLCGYVYVDLNNNGLKDANESGIPDVVLNLTGTDTNGNAVTQTVSTQGLAAGATDIGRYCFVDLPTGTYTITETQPVDYTDGRVTVGTFGGTSAVNTIASIPLTTAGGTGEAYNFGERPTAAAALSGFVWLDTNHDRNRNEATGRGGWTVELVRGDIGGAYSVVATTTTNTDGSYRFDGLPPGGGYGVLFRNPAGNYVYGYLQNLTLPANAELSEQNQPIDPSGVVYDVLTRNPVAGATVRISGPAGFDPAIHLVGGAANVAQVTGPTGEYRYLLLPGSPTGTYRLDVTVPSGYVQRVSTMLPACTATLTVGSAATPWLVQRQDTAPPLSQRQHDPNTCPSTAAGLAASNDSTQYYLAFVLGATSTHVLNNHIPIESTPTTTRLIVSKTTPKMDVTRGELVPYTITVRNPLDLRQTDISIVDMIPPGFRYRAGSASVAGLPREPAINGRELRFPPVTIERNGSVQIKLMLIIGTGVSEGEYVNQAWAVNAFSNVVASNVATAVVRITPNPDFDCSDIIGKVFDDKNRNGYQDDGEPGLANVRLATVNGLLITTDSHGRYHITCAEVPNEQRGSNFVLKLDERTLPTGYRLTTENPGAVVLTRGKMSKLNFGAAIHRVVRIDVMNDAFEPGSVALKAAWTTAMAQVLPALEQEKSVLRIGYGRTGADDARLAQDRVRALQREIAETWRTRGGGYHLVIETEVYHAGAGK